MPRLHGYRERLHANMFDALALADLGKGNAWGNRLFGSAGRERHLSNMIIAGQLSSDQTFVVLQLYARTNIFRGPVNAEIQEIVGDAFMEGRRGDAVEILRSNMPSRDHEVIRRFNEWAHAARVVFTIGQKPMFDASAIDMLDRRQAFVEAKHGDQVKMVEVPGLETDPEPRLAIDKSEMKHGLLRPLIIPVRQNFSATIESHEKTVENLLAVLPTDVAPEPLFWVHAEGLQTRDVA